MFENVSLLLIGGIISGGAILWHYGKLAGILQHIKEVGHPVVEKIETKATGFVAKIKEEVKTAEEAAKKE